MKAFDLFGEFLDELLRSPALNFACRLTVFLPILTGLYLLGKWRERGK